MTLMVVVIVTIFYNVTTMLQINLLCGDFVTSCFKLRWGRNAFNHGWSASFCKHSPWSSFSERGVSWNFVLKVTQGGLQTSKEGLTGSQNINQKKKVVGVKWWTWFLFLNWSQHTSASNLLIGEQKDLCLLNAAPLLSDLIKSEWFHKFIGCGIQLKLSEAGSSERVCSLHDASLASRRPSLTTSNFSRQLEASLTNEWHHSVHHLCTVCVQKTFTFILMLKSHNPTTCRMKIYSSTYCTQLIFVMWRDHNFWYLNICITLILQLKVVLITLRSLIQT